VTGILFALLVYNFICVFSFSAVYSTIDFEKHFNLPENVKNNYSTRLYYAFAIQATVMAGEIYPTTDLGHTIVSLQILTAWLVTLVLIVPWISAATAGRHHRAMHRA